MFYKLFIRYWDNRVIELFVFAPLYKDLYAYIGYKYSNDIEEIKRIDYKSVSVSDVSGHYYYINDFGKLVTY